MGKLAKRRTQHDDVAVVTNKVPHPNWTELLRMCNRCDDNHEGDENEVSNHEVSNHEVSNHVISNHEVSNHEVSNHEVSNHEVSNHEVSNFEVSNHEVSNHEVSNHEVSNHEVSNHEISNHEVSNHEGTLDMSVELCLENIRKKNMEDMLKVEEVVGNLLNTLAKTTFACPPETTIPRRTTYTPFTAELSEEMIEDLKYIPPKRFHPRDAGWITNRLYTYLETKLAARYDYLARVRAEKLVENMYNFTKKVRRNKVAPKDVYKLKVKLALLDIVVTHFDFYIFIHNFMPKMIREKVIPDAVNKYISYKKWGIRH